MMTLLQTVPEAGAQGEPVHVRIAIQERGGADIRDQVLRLAVPFASGTLHSVDGFRLVDADGREYPVQAEAMKAHFDGSLQWLAPRRLDQVRGPAR